MQNTERRLGGQVRLAAAILGIMIIGKKINLGCERIVMGMLSVRQNAVLLIDG